LGTRRPAPGKDDCQGRQGAHKCRIDRSPDWLGTARFSELRKFDGIGQAKAISILAALELGRRRKDTVVASRPVVRSSRDTYEYIYDQLIELPHEEFWVIFLNRANQVIDKQMISSGGIAGTFVDPKLIFQKALDVLASSLILVHNHPSGQLRASQQDIELTKKLVAGAKLLDMRILDHLIICGKNYYSFADEGLL
jgi:DNA repair protein RadC